jgi:hypothetical protein
MVSEDAGYSSEDAAGISEIEGAFPELAFSPSGDGGGLFKHEIRSNNLHFLLTENGNLIAEKGYSIAGH